MRPAMHPLRQGPPPARDWQARFAPGDFVAGEAIPEALRADAVIPAEPAPAEVPAAAQWELEAPRPLRPRHILRTVAHPREALHDREMYTALHTRGFFDQSLARAFGLLSKPWQREVARWLAELRREAPQRSWDLDQIVIALARVPAPLRRGAWELAHTDGDVRGEICVHWLRKIADLPEDVLTAWVGWLPHLQAQEPMHRDAMALLAGRNLPDLETPLRLAMAHPAAFGELVAQYRRAVHGGQRRDDLRRALCTCMSRTPALSTLEELADDLRRRHPRQHDASFNQFLKDKTAGSEETRAAMGQLAWSSQATHALALTWALEMPVAHRAAVARMLCRQSLLPVEALQALHKDARCLVLVAAAGHATAAASQGEVVRWLRRLRHGSLNPLCATSVIHFVRLLEKAGIDSASLSLALRAAVLQHSQHALSLLDCLRALGQLPGWTWLQAAHAVIAAPREALDELVVRARQGSLVPRTASQAVGLNAGQRSLVARFPAAVGDAPWIQAVAAMPPSTVSQVAAARTDALRLEAALLQVEHRHRQSVERRLMALAPCMDTPTLCVLARLLGRHADAEALLERLMALPVPLRYAAAARLLALPPPERAAWTQQVVSAQDAGAALDTLAGLRDADGRQAHLLTLNLLGEATPETRRAVWRVFEPMAPAQRSATLDDLRATLHALDLGEAAALPLLLACKGAASSPRSAALLTLRLLAPCLRTRSPAQRLALLRSLATREVPTTHNDYVRGWSDARHDLAAVGQAMLWLFSEESDEEIPVVEATEPWQRHEQIMRRAEALATRTPVGQWQGVPHAEALAARTPVGQPQGVPRPQARLTREPLRLTDPALVHAASQRGAHALAVLLGAHAELPPHALYALHEAAPHGAAAARALFADALDAARAAACAWGGSGPLPEGLAAELRRRFALPLHAPRLESLFAFCDSLGLPQAVDACLRVAALETLQGTAGAQQDPRSLRCVVCDEDTAGHTHLGGCQCPPALCDGCAVEAVTRVNDRLTCPTACTALLNRAYLERLGVQPPVIAQRLVALHRDRLRRVPEWQLADQGLAGRHVPPPPVGPDEIPPIRPGHERTSLRLLLSGLEAWPNYNGDGVHRECYVCAQPVQKGDACMHMHCGGAAAHEWDFERGPYDNRSRFATAGLQSQGYIPLARGALAQAGFYDGLPTGVLSAATRSRVERRRVAWLTELGGVVRPQEERETLRTGDVPAGGGFEAE